MLKVNYKDVYELDKYVNVTFPINVKIENSSIENPLRFLNVNYIINESFDQGFAFDINHDETLNYDGYTLRIKKDKIIIRYSTNRSFRYAMDSLNRQFNVFEGFLNLVYIEDEPSFKLRGIIEGYYGTPWTYEERHDMVTFMDENRLNVYMYAPKTDVYHREKWDVLYPVEELEQMINLKNSLEDKDIMFFYCISPGYKKDGCKAFDFCNDEDYEILYRKLDQVIENGCTKFGLLLDDIDYTLTEVAKERFETPGRAHSHICNKVYEYLNSKVEHDFEMVMCPTEYVQIGSTPYRDDLNKYMNDAIKVFWTGYNCCAEVITKQDACITQKAFNKNLFIWDNFPVTDFTYGVRQYMAPIQNRSSELSKYCEAYIINPMKDYYISKIAMYTMADYAWNSSKYDKDSSLIDSLDSVIHNFSKDSIDYVNFNYPSVLSYGDLEYEKELVENKEYDEILAIYKDAVKSSKAMLSYDLPLIDELRPWLNRCIKEEKIVKKIIKNTITKKELLKFLEDIHFSGCEILDELIKANNLLTDEEYETLITKRRGKAWYRVWENKR